MFFRRRKAAEPKAQPIVGKDGNLYVEEGQDYDDDEFETDSDYSSVAEEEVVEEEGLEYEEDPNEDLDSDSGSESDSVSESESSTDEDSTPETTENDEGGNVVEVETTTEVKDNPRNDTSIKGDVTGTVEVWPNKEIVNAGKAPLEEIADNKDEEKKPLLDTKIRSEKVEEVAINRKAKQEDDEIDAAGEEAAPSTSLVEKRSLLALAAEHDRVDIIKTILQSSNPDSTANKNDVAHLIQLLLNNKIIGNSTTNEKGPFNPSHLDDVFLPPLHIAVASSSTNAASCLLRMGADPSIRPNIPVEWDGPVWNDALNSGSTFSSPKAKRKADMKNHWRKLHGLSAWDVAFGSQFVGKDDKENSGGTGSWFGWSSSDNTSDDSQQRGPLFDIAPSKLEGIKHAFTAEALRAIGSDEVHRLRELIGSGMNQPVENQVGVKDHGVEIGGKDLVGWCVEMNAERCGEMLRELYSSSSTINGNSDEKQEKKAKAGITTSSEVVIGTAEAKEDNQGSTSTISDDEVTETNLYSLEIKLEENKVLASSLSLVLDNLAEEVSLTQGLLHQYGSNTNTALISQVRALKENRGDVEGQISEWEGRLADRIVELRMVLGWWEAKGGSKEDFAEIFDNSDGSLSSQVPLSLSPSNTTFAGDTQSLRSRVLEKTAQVTLSESKVRKLRTSIADLAEENSQNLVKVGKLGLTGAVSLARKLKEEVKEREHILQNLQQREAACRTRVCMIRNQLEHLNSEASIAHANEAATEIESGTSTLRTESARAESHEQVGTMNMTESHAQTSIEEAETEEDVEFDGNDDDDSSLIEYVNESDDDSDVEYEYYTDSEGEEEESTPQSELIRKGMSTALALKEEQHEFISFKLWELLMRIVGLSKKSIKETAQSTFEDLGNLPRAMIV